MRIKSFAAIIGCSIAVLAISTAFAFMYFTDRLHKLRDLRLRAAETIDAAHGLEASILAHSRESLLLELTNDTSHDAKRRVIVATALDKLKSASRKVNSGEEAIVIARLAAAIPDYFALRLQLEAEGKDAREIANSVSNDVDAIVSDAKHLIAINVANANRSDRETAAGNLLADWISAAVIMMFLVALPLVFLASRKHVYQPLVAITESLNAFRHGAVKEPPLVGLYELREMAKTVSSMINSLRHSRELQMQYLAAVAHDIRNPIGAIKMSAELGLIDGIQDEEKSAYFNVIARQSLYLNQMVSDLIDTTRLEGGSLHLDTSLCDLCDIAKDSVRLFQNYSPRHFLEYRGPDGQIICRVDPMRMSQVVNNIINNAIKYSPDGGTIDIAVTASKGQAILSVTDPGIGMSGEDMAGIFLPFTRSKRTHGKIPGVGLGLFTAKRIIETHSGRLTVASSVSKGSTFSISLPYDMEDSLRPDAPMGPSISAQPRGLSAAVMQ